MAVCRAPAPSGWVFSHVDSHGRCAIGADGVDDFDYLYRADATCDNSRFLPPAFSDGTKPVTDGTSFGSTSGAVCIAPVKTSAWFGNLVARGAGSVCVARPGWGAPYTAEVQAAPFYYPRAR